MPLTAAAASNPRTGAAAAGPSPKLENNPAPQTGAPQSWLRPPWSFFLSLLLTVLTTFVILALHRVVAATEPHTYVRPNIGLYIFPLLLLTWAGGRLLGMFTLGLSVFIAMYFLLPPQGWEISHPADWVSLSIFAVTNAIVVLGLDALQHKASLVAATAGARQENAHLLQEALEAQARLRSVAAASQEQRQREMLPHLLMPILPPQIAGLDLRVHYEALLKPDHFSTPFFDSFVVEENCTALVVGAVADAGLSATAVIAMLRNMLRSAVYRHASLTEAVTELNSMLAAHHLLPKPSRLFVGLYDASALSLASISCGRMPVLARRLATGQVEDLAEAGPLLGLAEGFQYRERRLPFSPGDILLLSPGGLTASEGAESETPDVSCWRRALENTVADGEAQQLIAQLIQTIQDECSSEREQNSCLLVARATDMGTG